LAKAVIYFVIFG